MAGRKEPTLGILGGLGPASTVCFYNMLTTHTEAAADSDHINMIISSHATTPDRTAFILGRSHENPMQVILEDARKLVEFGATVLAIPCNTAHYFYNAVHARIAIPMLHILGETVSYLHYLGVRRVGLLATVGTAQAGGYQTLCRDVGMECVLPDEEQQAFLMCVIYEQIKAGKTPDVAGYEALAEKMTANGCEALIVGCTELSILTTVRSFPFVDAMEVLACRTIRTCGKNPIGFPASMLNWVREVPAYAAF